MKLKLKLPIEVRKKYFTENGHGEKEIIRLEMRSYLQ